MRALRLGAIFIVFAVASSAFGQLQKREVSAFLTPESLSYSESTGTRFDVGFGLGINLWWTPRVSTELSAAVEHSHREFGAGSVRSYPVDVIAQYHFVNGSKWQPYAGVGGRAVSSRTAGAINGGVVYQLAPKWGLKLDGRHVLGNDRTFVDGASKVSVGLSWNF